MAMAMGVASMAVTAPRNSSLVCRAAATNRGEKEGFLDWFRTAFDRDTLSETNQLLGKVEDERKSSNGKAAGPTKRGSPVPPPKKTGFNFFGKK